MSLRRLMAALLFAGFMPLGAGALEVAHLAVRANDLAFCRQDGFLYASVAGSDASYGNRIVRIDPQSAQVIASLPVGSEPGKLAISDDGTVLYVALGGAAAVRQVDLTNLTAGIQFTLGSDTFFGPFYAEDLAVQPEHPQVVLVSLMNPGISPRHAGVAVFENGVARAQRTQRHTGSNRIEFSADPGRAYGYNNETTEFGFRRLIVDASGVRELDVTRNAFDGFGLEMLFDQGRVYGSNGQAMDPEARTLVGTFPLPDFTFDRAMVPDGNRAYFLTGSDGGMQLHEFDSQTFTKILQQGVNGIVGRASAMVRVGENGIAFRAASIFGGPSELVILRRIHEPPTADVRLAMTESSDPTTIGFSLQYSITVTNSGPQPAEGVVVRDIRPVELPFNFAFATQGFCTDSSGVVVCNLGTLPVNGSATITMSLNASTLGTYLNEATVYSQTLDPNVANNHAEESTAVTPPPSADFFIRLARAPDPATVGLPVVYELEVGNRGPSSSPLSWACNLFGAPFELVSVESPRGSCGNSLLCHVGVVAPGDSFKVRITVIPQARGSLATNAYVLSSVQDPKSDDNAIFDVLRVLPSATQLLNELVTLVQSFELRVGSEHTLVKRLRDARDGLVAADTVTACVQANQFVDHVNNMAGRGLTVEQASQLLPRITEVLEVLACDSRRRGRISVGEPVDGPGPGVLEDALVTGLASEEEVPARPTIVGARVRFSLPSASNVRVDLLDVQGRLLESAQHGMLPVGRHQVAWSSESRRLPSGIFFIRLSIGSEVTTLRQVIVH
jgi:uncharacterized repeat protein (TIGR01451 family)